MRGTALAATFAMARVGGRRGRGLARWRPVLTVAAVGIALSGAAYVASRNAARDRLVANYRDIAARLSLHLENRMVDAAETFPWLRAFYGASERVTADEFHSYAERAIALHPGTEALGWVPAAPANDEERAAWTVEVATPLASRLLRTNLEVSGDPGWRDALETARDAGEVVFTDVSGSPAGAGRIFGAIAVYRNGAPLDTQAERRRALLGWVVGIVRPGAIVQHAVTTGADAEDGLDITLVDHHPGSGTHVLHAHASGGRGAPPASDARLPTWWPRLRTVRHFRAGGLPFAVVVTATPQFAALHPPPSPLPLPALGLVATAVAIAWVLERRRASEAHEARLEIGAALARVARELMQVVETPVVLERVGELTVHAVGCDVGQTWAWDRREDCYRLVAGFGTSAAVRDHLAMLRIPRPEWAPIVDEIEADGLAIVTPRDASPTIGDVLRRLGSSGFVAIPLRRGTDVVGIQTAGYYRGRWRFDATQREIAMGVAQIASLALMTAQTIEDLAAANRIKDEFVSTMSHELRTPLHIILGYADFLRDPEYPPDDRADLGTRITHAAKQLLELIENTLQVDRLASGAELLRAETVLLSEVWEKLAAHCAEHPRRPAVALEWMPAATTALVTDVQKLKTVMRNLVSNALKFTEQGVVRVEATVEADELVLRVADTGIGIPPEHRDAIFDLFRQGDGSETRRYDGTGIGLYVARKLVEQLQGRIVVDSRVGVGSVFTVRLPRTIRNGRAAA